MLTSSHEIESPEWWRDVLLKGLADKSKRDGGIQLPIDYYEGKHDLAYATADFEKAFGGSIGDFADNWCFGVVQAPAERMRPQGVRFGEEGPTKEAWRFWERNELGFWSAAHHTSTFTTGYGYVLVWIDDDGESPLITVEDPLQMIVAYRPGTRKRAAALKKWKDEWTGKLNVTVYLPNAIYKWQSTSGHWTTGLSIGSWTQRPGAGEDWPLKNPLGVVPVVEFLNDPSLQMEGRSEIRRVIPLQKGVNKLTMDMLVASEYAAFRQRWATGVEIPIDPDTGKPIEAFESAIKRVWAVGDENAKFGDFAATDLKNYVDAIEMLVEHIAAQSRTPRHYFFQSGQNPSGDAIKSAETGLVAKVRERQLHFGERWEEVLRIAGMVAEAEWADTTDSELIWADPEFRTEGELTDAVIKQYQANLITWRTALRKLGYTPQQIEEMKGERAAEMMMRAAAGEVASLLGGENPEPSDAAA